MDRINNTEIKNPYLPIETRIIRKYDLTNDVRFFQVRYVEDDLVYSQTSLYKPGQFMMVSVPNIGEAPFSITSSPTRPGLLEFCIRVVGRVTSHLFQLKENDPLWLRGPFGNGFPVPKLMGRNLLFVAGGLGAAPLRSILLYALDNRDKFQKIYYLHGAKTPSDMLFREEFFRLRQRDDFDCYLTVESDPAGKWALHKGLVTELIGKIDIDAKNCSAVVCGPPVMYQYVIKEFLKIGVLDNHIFLTLERRMKCGVGKCGQCVVGHKYTCVDGPVFNLWDVQNIQGLI